MSLSIGILIKGKKEASLEEIFLSYYWAKFEEIEKNNFRFDTRVYLNSIKNPSDNDICIGAIVGKNPGSAIPSNNKSNDFQEIDLDGDQLLPNIKSIFLKAYKLSNKTINENAYIQVLNLMYVCDKELSQAINKIKNYPNPQICVTEEKYFPFLWYVWGNDNKNLNMYKDRFYHLNAGTHFYLNTKTEGIIDKATDFKDSARHTQGLSHDLVVPYISKII